MRKGDDVMKGSRQEAAVTLAQALPPHTPTGHNSGIRNKFSQRHRNPGLSLFYDNRAAAASRLFKYKGDLWENCDKVDVRQQQEGESGRELFGTTEKQEVARMHDTRWPMSGWVTRLRRPVIFSSASFTGSRGPRPHHFTRRRESASILLAGPHAGMECPQPILSILETPMKQLVWLFEKPSQAFAELMAFCLSLLT